ncbi:MAG: hypothetical protein QXP55_01535 [Nitrososphaerales archaeon]
MKDLTKLIVISSTTVLPLLLAYSTIFLNLHNSSLLLSLSVLYGLIIIVMFAYNAYAYVSERLFTFIIILLTNSFVIPTILAKDPVLGGDLGRELFISHVVKEFGNISSLETAGLKDQITYTGHVFLAVILQSLTRLSSATINSVLSLLTASVTALFILIFISHILKKNILLAFIMVLLISSQYNFIYLSQQGLRSTIWISLFIATLIAILLKQNRSNRILSLILYCSLALFYYSYSMLFIVYLFLLTIIYYLIRRNISVLKISIVYSVITIIWHLDVSYVKNLFPSIVESFLSSLKEIFTVSEVETVYLESFEYSLAWRITILLNMVYALITGLFSIMALYNLIIKRVKVTDDKILFIAGIFFGTFTIFMTSINTGLRLSIGFNRALYMGLVASIPYICSFLSRCFSSDSAHNSRTFVRTGSVIIFTFLSLTLITYATNTGLLHNMLGDDCLPYMGREKESRRYATWSVPYIDVVGYKWIFYNHKGGGKIIEHSYMDNVYLYLGSEIHFDQNILNKFVTFKDYHVSFTNLNRKEDFVIPIRRINLIRNEIFLKGASLGISEKLNVSIFSNNMSVIYNNGWFLVLSSG